MSILSWRFVLRQCILLFVICLPLNAASTLTLDDILTVDQLKQGMKGKGKSVFEGTKIEEFDVTIIGILHRVDFDQDLILVRIDSGTVIKKNTGVISGMSGSPIFVGKKLVGAIAYAWSFSKVPIAGVQPIAQMLQSLNPAFTPPKRRTVTFRPKGGLLNIQGERISEVMLVNNYEEALSVRREGVGVLTPVITPLMVSGLNRFAVEFLRRSLRHYNLLVVEAPTGIASSVRASPKLEPGAAVAIQLANGDVDISAVGTATWVEGNLVLAFGHPALGLGEIEMPMATAYVWDIVSRQSISFKLATPIKPVGTFTQDRNFATCGFLGRRTKMLAMNVRIRDAERGFHRTYNVHLIRQKQLIDLLALSTLLGSMYVYISPAEEGTMKMSMEVELDGLPKIKRENMFDMQAGGGFGFFIIPTSSPVGELMNVVSALIDNPYRDVTLERINIQMQYEGKRRLVWIDQVTATKAQAEPGEAIPVTLRLRERGEKFHTLRLNLRIPPTAKPGIIQVAISGGMLGRQARARVGARPPRAYNINQLIELLNADYQNDQLVVCMSTGRVGVELDGREVCPIPTSMIEALFSLGTSKILPMRDFVETKRKVEWLISGMAVLTIRVESKEKEKEEPFRPPAPPEGAPPAEGAPSEAVPEGATFTMPRSDKGLRYELFDEFAVNNGMDFVDLVEAIAARARAAARSFFPESSEIVLDLTKIEAHNTDSSRAAGDEAQDQATGDAYEEAPQGIEASQSQGQGKKQLDRETPPPMPSWEEVESLEVGKVTKPAPRVPPTPPGRTQALARAPQVWVMEKFEDFVKGEFKGTCATYEGELKVGLCGETVYNPAELCIWTSMIDASNSVYAGTWMPARVWKIGPDGERKMLAEWSEEVGVVSMVKIGSDLYCGLVPSGKIYRIGSDGQKLAADLKGEHPWAMVAEKDGTILIATGPNGRIYRLRGGELSLLAELPDRHAIAMVTDGESIYVGTSPKGRVYRIDSLGRVHSVFETPLATVQCMALDKDKNLYVGTAGQARVYIIRKDGSVKEVSKLDGRHVFAMTGYEGGIVAAVCPKVKLYRIDPNGSIDQLYRGDEPFLTSIVKGSDGTLFATATGGGVVAFHPKRREWVVYESPVKDAGTVARWGAIRWYADMVDGSAIAIETRSGNTATPDNSWSHWSETYPMSGAIISSPPARYIQFRVRLYPNDDGESVRLKRVELTYMPKNRPPELTVKQPSPGAIICGTYKLQWEGKDPDKDRLVFEAQYSSDGIKWVDVEEPKPAKGSEKQTEQADEQKDTVTTKNEMNWDTTKVRDGIYHLRVIVSDRISNPVDAEQAERIVYPIVVDNTPPEIWYPAPGEKLTEPPKKLKCYDATTFIASAEYRVDGGEWIAAACSDGVFDSKVEDVLVDISRLPAGKHSLELRVRDGAGNERVTKWEYEWRK
ncbi:MAG: SpoIVB peptidase S55 domain-containing protein [Armatimonadota bacterium]|nr:hypothetical protein [Armatimonadota bacterium]MCX7777941.1 hypothetical protein [Armatimonadota bacterium]MDW8025626.1 SpoIVB peptidase S55 domain-containing protein [Armatimonadota bacterium]